MRENHICGCAGGVCHCCSGDPLHLGTNSNSADVQSLNVVCALPPCQVENSNKKAGSGCACADGFVGKISWGDSGANGTCRPATCSVENSNEKPGLGCHCLDGFEGNISWTGSTALGPCKPAPCNVVNSNEKHGKACHCKDGFAGNAQWKLGKTVCSFCLLALMFSFQVFT